jgi:CDGSH-type Zn-finger protein
VIVPYQDGPYLVRGPVVLRDQHGQGIGAGRRIIALCRCGKSQTRPFCDGTHRLIKFRAPSPSEKSRPTTKRLVSNGSTTTGADPGELAGPSLRRVSLATDLSQIHKQLASLLTDSCERRPAERLRAAESLVAAACVLVVPSTRNPSPQCHEPQKAEWRQPCLCLVRGAIEALRPLAGDSDRRVSKVVEQLAVLKMLLQSGVSRS